MDVALTVTVTVVEFPLVWLVNNDGEYVMGSCLKPHHYLMTRIGGGRSN